MVIAAVFTEISFTACNSDDIVTPETNDKTVIETAPQTVFSTSDDATRTSMNYKYNFFWEVGDKIWVDNGSEYVWSAQSDITDAKQSKAKFIVDGAFSGAPVNVLYTGYANGDTTKTFSNKVTIANVQTQKAWNDGSHLGTSGDCGTAIAYKQTNAPGYKFTIDHKASYLLIYPYLHNALDSGSYTLEKIEIYSDLSASSIAGEFPFTHANGLADLPTTGTGKQEITLNCRNVAGSGFSLRTGVPDPTATSNPAAHCFVVIAPGTHQLTIKYVIKNASGTEFDFYKDIDSKKYVANGVYTFVHELKDAVVDYGFSYYEKSNNSPTNQYFWGMTTPRDGGSIVYNTSTARCTDGFWADIPNYFATSWYVTDGSYWDSSTEWTYVMKNGTTQKHRAGVWFRKWQYISGASETTFSGWSSKTPQRGRPDASVISQYFFIPASAPNGPNPLGPIRIWNSEPVTEKIAYTTEITPNGCTCGALYFKSTQWLCIPLNVDGSPWWQ